MTCLLNALMNALENGTMNGLMNGLKNGSHRGMRTIRSLGLASSACSAVLVRAQIDPARSGCPPRLAVDPPLRQPSIDRAWRELSVHPMAPLDTSWDVTIGSASEAIGP